MLVQSYFEIITSEKTLDFLEEDHLMDKVTHQVRCEQWTKIINECLASGMNKTAWCKANSISDKSFFYWQRILRNEAYATTKHLPVPIEEKKET